MLEGLIDQLKSVKKNHKIGSSDLDHNLNQYINSLSVIHRAQKEGKEYGYISARIDQITPLIKKLLDELHDGKIFPLLKKSSQAVVALQARLQSTLHNRRQLPFMNELVLHISSYLSEGEIQFKSELFFFQTIYPACFK